VTSLEVVEIPDRGSWRAWLRRHHASSPGVWVVFHKGRAGANVYEDFVREALCFGWIDSLIKRLDEDRYARKFTPRKPTSRWSALNRKRWAELSAQGRLARAGRAAAPRRRPSSRPPAIPDLPPYVAAALKADAKAWAFFKTLAPSYRRLYVGWIHTAKRPETREKRIREAIALLAAGRKPGLR
jgi:uncharacterized protein YdeI (YjbR/CyaY-like superfamily)